MLYPQISVLLVAFCSSVLGIVKVHYVSSEKNGVLGVLRCKGLHFCAGRGNYVTKPRAQAHSVPQTQPSLVLIFEALHAPSLRYHFKFDIAFNMQLGRKISSQ